MLLGETDLVPLAQALHRRTLGAEQPFIVCDRRRRNLPKSVRSPKNYDSGVAAWMADAGGSLCVRRSRLPLDFSSMVARVRDPNANAQLIVCAGGRYDTDPFLVLPRPIRVPSLRTRVSELPRVVDEYLADAIAELGAIRAGFTEADRQWIIDHGPWTLAVIETTTLRLVALRVSRNVSNAAARLGMAPVSLSRWIDRRKLRRMLAAT